MGRPVFSIGDFVGQRKIMSYLARLLDGSLHHARPMPPMCHELRHGLSQTDASPPARSPAASDACLADRLLRLREELGGESACRQEKDQGHRPSVSHGA